MDLKQHPSLSDVWVSPDGRVFRELTPSLDSGGYHQIRNGDIRQRRHTLVCETYHGERPDGAVVRHNDGVSSNDHKDNLQWGTQAENCADTVSHGKSTKVSKNPQAQLTEVQAKEIKQRRADGEKGRVLAQEFGVSEQVVCDIHKGRLWWHV